MVAYWKERRERKAFLALADGSVFHGWAFGARRDGVGEAVFNTGMSGYQEIISDPSYAGQFVVLTTPEVGNYGCNAVDLESRGLFLNGLVVRELNQASNWRAEEDLEATMERNGKPGLAGVDTRELTLLLRTKGAQKAYLHVEEKDMREEDAVDAARAWEGLDGQDYAERVTTETTFQWNEAGSRHVVVYDFGVKYNILRLLAENDMQVTVVPAHTPARDVLAMHPDGVMLSNGPADPAALGYAIQNTRELLAENVPLMGICLGHQILGLACGSTVKRLKFGHHGCNHPVRNERTGDVAISSQNHNFALDSLPDSLEMTFVNLNDGTVEGIRHRSLPAFGIQFHPEAAPGPHDAARLFRDFRLMMEK